MKNTTAPALAKTARHAATRPAADRDPSTDQALKLWVVLARAYSAIARHVGADIARHDITTTEFGILEVLYHKGPLLLGEIQRKVLVTSGGITYLVDRLVEKGLVTREACPTDRRARYAVLTPAGQRLIKKIFPEHAERIARAMNGLSAKEQADTTALLRRLGHAAAALEVDE
jgi:MarR family 2-MHQ and catechol resistance regulon transcriptional repressor